MQVALHSNWIHFVIVVLVVADALIVIFELLLDVGAFGKTHTPTVTHTHTHIHLHLLLVVI